MIIFNYRWNTCYVRKMFSMQFCFSVCYFWFTCWYKDVDCRIETTLWYIMQTTSSQAGQLFEISLRYQTTSTRDTIWRHFLSFYLTSLSIEFVYNHGIRWIFTTHGIFYLKKSYLCVWGVYPSPWWRGKAKDRGMGRIVLSGVFAANI